MSLESYSGQILFECMISLDFIKIIKKWNKPNNNYELNLKKIHLLSGIVIKLYSNEKRAIFWNIS